MRILMLFFIGATLGILTVLLSLPIAVSLIVIAISCVAVFFCRKKARSRNTIILLLAAFVAGLAYAEIWNDNYVLKAEAFSAQKLSCAVELTDYPVKQDYGYSVEGKMCLNDCTFRTIVYFYNDLGELEPGDILIGNGKLSSSVSTSGSENYYRSVGIPMKLSFRSCSKSVHTNAGAFCYFPQRLAKRLKTAVQSCFPSDVTGFLTALLTGDKNDLSYAETVELKTAGIYHTIAVSGMHVSILMSAMYVFMLHNRKLYTVFGLIVLSMYVCMTGMHASVMRAAVMQLFFMTAPLVKRESDPLTSLSAAGIILCIVNPWCLLNTGFQLSFLATAGIVLLAPKLYNGFHIRRRQIRISFPVVHFFASSVSQTLAAMAFTTPILLFQFGMISIIGILTNLLTILAITYTFTAGLVTAAFYCLFPRASSLFALPGTWLVRYIRLVVSSLSKLPFAAAYLPDTFTIIAILLLYAVILTGLLIPRKRLLWYTAGLGICACIFFAGIAVTADEKKTGEFRFTALDVGQGQCLLLESAGETLAFDCGNSRGDEAGEILSEMLLARHYSHLNYLILSHYDLDHISGVEQLMNRVQVDYLLIPEIEDDTGHKEALIRTAEENGTIIISVGKDSDMMFGNGIIHLIAPLSEIGGNESSLLTIATFQDYDIMAMGDLPIEQEETLLQKYELPDIEVLVAGHHGAKNSTSTELLEAVKPEYVVISVGPNHYGHPSTETIDRISAYGAEICRTDIEGNIIFSR